MTTLIAIQLVFRHHVLAAEAFPVPAIALTTIAQHRRRCRTVVNGESALCRRDSKKHSVFEAATLKSAPRGVGRRNVLVEGQRSGLADGNGSDARRRAVCYKSRKLNTNLVSS